MDETVNPLGAEAFGVRSDLQAEVRHEPNACDGWVLDLALGCSHACVYCLFSHLEKTAFQLMNPGYRGELIKFELDRFMERTEFPPVIYLSYSSDPLQPLSVDAAVAAVRKLVAHGVKIFLVTKGLLPDELLRIVEAHPQQFAIQIGITSADPTRNARIEPGAPTYAARLGNLKALSKFSRLHSLAARIDPMFPLIDDTEESLRRVLDDLRGLRVSRAVVSYLIVTDAIKKSLSKSDYLRPSMETLSENVSTISKRKLYSLPLREKIAKLLWIRQLCAARGIGMHVCGCKDEQLKTAGRFDWVCHPYRSHDGVASIATSPHGRAD